MSSLTIASVAQHILVIRGQKVMLDRDLAKLYGVTTARLNEQVKRNTKRFPERFMFPLTQEEFRLLKSHFATSSWGGTRKTPSVFTEHGALMLASVLNSPRAVETSILVIDAFVRMRELLASDKELAARVIAIEHTLTDHSKELQEINDVLRYLTTEPEAPKGEIGY
jgi:phage regulator Rha-like protein